MDHYLQCYSWDPGCLIDCTNGCGCCSECEYHSDTEKQKEVIRAYVAELRAEADEWEAKLQ